VDEGVSRRRREMSWSAITLDTVPNTARMYTTRREGRKQRRVPDTLREPPSRSATHSTTAENMAPSPLGEAVNPTSEIQLLPPTPSLRKREHCLYTRAPGHAAQSRGCQVAESPLRARHLAPAHYPITIHSTTPRLGFISRALYWLVTRHESHENELVLPGSQAEHSGSDYPASHQLSVSQGYSLAITTPSPPGVSESPSNRTSQHPPVDTLARQ
jgi:hypothetical protein